MDRHPPNASRRALLLGVLGAASAVAFMQVRSSGSSAHEVDGESLGDWRTFQSRFIAAEGRVVDTGNAGVTHSEGQGYGMLFAEHFDDRATFDSLLGWTRRTLRRPNDSLHAWRFRPDAAVPVDDPNNATDGDLLIALALLRAGQRWREPRYTDLAGCIGVDILRCCVRSLGDVRVLLPAAFGFDQADRIVINPSYYIFPALTALAALVPDPAWDMLQADGLRLIRLGRFGRWRLPADWLQINNGVRDDVTPAQGWPARFSWDAVRVPLNLAWAGLTNEPALGAAATFWANPGHNGIPAWVDLSTGSIAPYAASRGVNAIAEIARATRTGLTTPTLPHIGDADDYYSAALTLLSRIVWRETSGAATAV